MKKWILLLLITLTISCGKKEEVVTTPNHFTSPLHRTDCQYSVLRAWWCRYGKCRLFFRSGREYVVNYGVWYAGHTYKICNGTVYN